MSPRLAWLLAALAVAVAAAAIFLTVPSSVEASPQAGPARPQLVEYCLLFGVGQQEPARWDGSIEASGARVAGIRGWRAAEDDAIDGASWRLATRRVVLTRGNRNVERYPALENGVYITSELTDANASFRVSTEQGDFSFRAADLQPGSPKAYLDGKVSVEQTPVTTALTSSREEQDFPALAVRDGRAYLAYVEFTHGDRSQKWARRLRAEPESFDPLRRPAGGDQVLLREYDVAARSWGEPQAVSAKGQDVYKAAVAVDGEDRVWVVWSARVKGDFDLYARVREGGGWSDVLQVTKAAGPDLTPVAATDSDGDVWIAWQGYRGSFDVLAARQRGRRFGPEQRVSTSPANDWAPAIAAGPDGEIAVSWDTYDKGDYDVYVRRMKANGRRVRMEAPQPAAASLDFEARSSVAYDAAGRLWVAWEQSYQSWGKDFGAYETTGSGLYQNTWVQARAFDGSRWLEPEDDLIRILTVNPPSNPLNRGPGPGHDPLPLQPDPSFVDSRRPSATPYPRSREAKVGYPRLATDQSGNVFLAYRSSAGGNWMALGTIWFEHLAKFDGERWQGPVFVGQSDGMLDQRSALASTGPGQLLMASATDGRFTKSGRSGPTHENIQFDLVAHELDVGSAPGGSRLKAATPPAPAKAPEAISAELAQVERLRGYRAQVGGESLQPMRGEFHRHTSVSGDGGLDGDIIDAWRYLVDASYMDWAGCCDHDNGSGREYTWWWAQKMTDAYHLAGKFVPLFSYERSVSYPEGHRNVLFAERGIRPLPRLPRTAEDSPADPAPDTQMLYDYLRKFDGVAAVHTSALAWEPTGATTTPRSSLLSRSTRATARTTRCPGRLGRIAQTTRSAPGGPWGSSPMHSTRAIGSPSKPRAITSRPTCPTA